MITTILEVLVAVVVLIVIIAVAALRFLRADDSDTFDDIPAEPHRTRPHPAESHPHDEPGPAERSRSRRPELARGRAADDRAVRQYAQPDGRGKPAYSDRGGRSRPAAEERSSSPGTGPQRPVPVGARQGKAARPAAAAPDETSWDSLSDVDYWTELAADKPLGSAEAGGALSSAKPPRRGMEPKADAPRAADMPAGRPDSGLLPTRQRSQSRPGAGRPGIARPSAEPATQSLAALARLGDQSPSQQRPALPSRPGTPNGQRPSVVRQANGQPQATGQRPAGSPRPGATGQRPAGGQRALPPALPAAPAAQTSRSGGQARPPLPMDDDPLTSPSFPAINTSDSRSYRTRSRSSSAPGSPGTGGAGSGSYGEPPRQLPAYPDHSTSTPNGYPVQPATTATNPYGSFAGGPPPTYSEPASAHLDAAAYGSGYAAGQQAAAAANWYGGSTDTGQAINGYLPAPASGNGAGNGYSPADYSVNYQAPLYQGGGHASPSGGYGQPGPMGPYDQGGYRGPDAGYGQDGYEAYPGYGGAGR